MEALHKNDLKTGDSDEKRSAGQPVISSMLGGSRIPICTGHATDRRAIRRRKWIIGSAICFSIILSVSLSVGLSVGLSVRNSHWYVSFSRIHRNVLTHIDHIHLVILVRYD